MSDASDQSPHRLPQRVVFTPSAAELAAARKLVAVRLNRALKGFGYWGLLSVLILGIGLIVYAAYESDLFDIWSLEPVLITAYAAFIAGNFANAMVAKWQYRRLSRAYFEGEDKVQWEISSDDIGMTWRSQTVETRMSWRDLCAVEDTGAMLLLWRDVPSHTTFIPARAFASAEARAAFVAAVAARIAAARGGS